MSETMMHRDVYVRLTDPNGKQKTIINHHRIWDLDRFVAAQKSQYEGSRVKEEDRRLITLATVEEYLEAR
jgi:hypothetical protein